MATPIFIVGTPRSGTSWLSSMLGRHSRMACVQEGTAGKKGGVNESAFFSYVDGTFGDLKNDNNLIMLIEIFASSTFFIFSGVDKDIFYKQRPGTYSDFFRLLMDHLAVEQGADLWFEKTPSHTFHLKEISRYYPDAKFVTVRRKIIDQIKSFIKLDEIISGVKTENLSFLKKKAKLIDRVLSYYTHTKHLDNFIAKHPDKIFQIDYEELKDSTEQVVRKLCTFMGIDFEDNILQKGYTPNTSFQIKEERLRVLSKAEIKSIKLLGFIMKLLPYQLYRIMYLTKRTVQRGTFPYWFFSYKIEKYGWGNVFGKGHERVKVNSGEED